MQLYEALLIITLTDTGGNQGNRGFQKQNLNVDNVHSSLQFTKHVHILILKVDIAQY